MIKNLNTVLSDKPCAKGHVGLRYKLKNRCVQCARERVKRHYGRNPEPAKKRAALREKMPEAKLVHKQWYQKNAESVKERAKAWGENNKEKKLQIRKKYYQSHKAEARINTARYFEHIRLATPAWANLKAIAKIYAEAQKQNVQTGTLHSVDHIIPLRGKTVCGLHIALNLRVIPFLENVRKGNRLLDAFAS